MPAATLGSAVAAIPAADTFVGVDVGADTTVFYRNAPHGLEGFVVDNGRLLQTLKHRVLEQRGLSDAVTVHQVQGPASAQQLSHKFAEPFSAITAQLELGPLDSPWGQQLLLPLTGAIAALILGILWATFRVVRTQLEFAQRQNNFVSAVSHELKTPLTAIRMHGEMLEEGLILSPEKEQESFHTITTQAERLSRLIDNVLWISNVERKTLPARELDICSAVRRAVETLGPQAEKQGATLILDLPRDKVGALADADALEQILLNLVDNALKYAADATDRRITLTVEADGNLVRVMVRDRGPGVAESQRKKIFDAFYRVGDEMTRRTQGTGLGLNLVAHLAARMGARVSVRDAQPGALFVVELQASSAAQISTPKEKTSL